MTHDQFWVRAVRTVVLRVRTVLGSGVLGSRLWVKTVVL